MNYELLTMNCYELLETVIWIAVSDPEGECFGVSEVNKELEKWNILLLLSTGVKFRLRLKQMLWSLVRYWSLYKLLCMQRWSS